MTEGITVVSPAKAPQIDNVEFVDTAPATPQPRRMSELGQVTTTSSQPMQVAQPAQPQAAEGVEPAPTPEQPAETQAEVDYKAKYEALLQSRTIPQELLDQMVEFPNGKDDPLIMAWRDIPGAVLRHKDYTLKTTEVAQLRKQVEQTQQAQRGWVQAIAAGAPEQRLQALRAVVPEDGIKDLLRAYVQQEQHLLSMPPEMVEMYKRTQAEADRAAALERKLQMMEQQQQYAYQEQVQQEGIKAPAIQVVLRTVEQKLPQVLAKYGLDGNEAAYDTAINMLIRAVEGNRNDAGQWTIRPGVAPSDDDLERAVSVAREQLTELAQRFVGRAPQAAPPVPSGTGPALPKGAPGNVGQPQPRRFSDMGR